MQTNSSFAKTRRSSDRIAYHEAAAQAERRGKFQKTQRGSRENALEVH